MVLSLYGVFRLPHHTRTHTRTGWMRVRNETLHKMTDNKTKIDLFFGKCPQSIIKVRKKKKQRHKNACKEVCVVGSNWMTEYVKMKGYRYMHSFSMTLSHSHNTHTYIPTWQRMCRADDVCWTNNQNWYLFDWTLTSRHQKQSRRRSGRTTAIIIIKNRIVQRKWFDFYYLKLIVDVIGDDATTSKMTSTMSSHRNGSDNDSNNQQIYSE